MNNTLQPSTGLLFPRKVLNSKHITKRNIACALVHAILTLIDRRHANVVVEELAELHQEHGVARVRVADVVVEGGGDLTRATAAGCQSQSAAGDG